MIAPGHLIARAREKAGFKQEELAEELRIRALATGVKPIGRPMLARVEIGSSWLRPDLLALLEIILGLRENELSNVYYNDQTGRRASTNNERARTHAALETISYRTKRVPVDKIWNSTLVDKVTRVISALLGAASEDVVEVTEDLGFVEKGMCMVFMPTKLRQPGVYQDFQNRERPELRAVGFINTADETQICLAHGKVLVTSEWEPVGWCYAICWGKDIDLKSWTAREEGIGPTTKIR